MGSLVVLTCALLSGWSKTSLFPKRVVQVVDVSSWCFLHVSSSAYIAASASQASLKQIHEKSDQFLISKQTNPVYKEIRNWNGCRWEGAAQPGTGRTEEQKYLLQQWASHSAGDVQENLFQITNTAWRFSHRKFNLVPMAATVSVLCFQAVKNWSLREENPLIRWGQSLNTSFLSRTLVKFHRSSVGSDQIQILTLLA